MTCGLQKFQCHFWVPSTIYFKVHALAFQESVDDNFEIAHKPANFKSGVQYPLKIVLVKYSEMVEIKGQPSFLGSGENTKNGTKKKKR